MWKETGMQSFLFESAVQIYQCHWLYMKMDEPFVTTHSKFPKGGFEAQCAGFLVLATLAVPAST